MAPRGPVPRAMDIPSRGARGSRTRPTFYVEHSPRPAQSAQVTLSGWKKLGYHPARSAGASEPPAGAVEPRGPEPAGLGERGTERPPEKRCRTDSPRRARAPVGGSLRTIRLTNTGDS